MMEVVVDAGEIASFEVTYPDGECDLPPRDAAPDDGPGLGAADDGARIPQTGSNASVLGWLGAVLLAVGALLLALPTARRRWDVGGHG